MDKNKSNKSKSKKEGNLFDKVLHEIADAAILPVVTDKLNLTVINISYRKAKMQTTLEREVDECYWLETEDGGEMILHIEYQSHNDSKMIFRVNLYVAMIRYYYPNVPIKSVVVFVGNGKPTMRTQLTIDEIFTGFEMIDAKTLDHKKLLASNKPGKMITAILGDYEEDQAEEVIHKIVRRLRELCKAEMEIIKHCRQLLILSFLRNLGELTKKIVANMSVHIDIAKTSVFRNLFEEERLTLNRLRMEAEARAEKERKEKEDALEKQERLLFSTVSYFLKSSTLSEEEIADIAQTSVETILRIKKSLEI